MAPVTRYVTYFNEQRIRLENCEEGEERGLAEHSPIGADGADIEDGGRLARTFQFRAWFWDVAKPTNEGYSWDDHFTFLDTIRLSDTVHTFVHPSHGPISGRVRSYNCRADNRINSAAIDVTFVEQLLGDFTTQPAVVGPLIASAYENLQVEQLDAAGDAVRSSLGAQAGAVLSKALSPSQSLVVQFAQASANVRSYLRMVDTAVSALEGTLALVDNAAESIVSVIDFGTDIPGRIVGAIAKTVDKLAAAAQSVADAPDQFLASYNTSVVKLKEALKNIPGIDDNLLSMVDAAAAAQAAIVVADQLEADETRRDEMRSLEEGAPSSLFDVRSQHEPWPEVLSLEQLEYSVAQLRTMMDTALAANPGATQLRTMAHDFQRWVNDIKLERERIITVTVDTTQSLFDIMHRYNVPVSKAERVLSLNPQISNPHYCIGEVKLYV